MEKDVTASRDLSSKSMTYNIKPLNALYEKNGYLLARIYTKEEAINKGCKADDLLCARIERGLSIEDITSKILKINVISIHWNSNDTVKIEYLEK